LNAATGSRSEHLADASEPPPIAAVPGVRFAWAPLLALVALLGMVIARSWLCDDAYITLRTVDNLVHGYGARWNIADRVQTYTHPLWMLLLVGPYAVTHEPYFSALALSWVLTASAIGVLVYRLAATRFTAGWACVALALCAAFADFSTGGLENPLTHVLLAWFSWTTLAHAPSRARVFPATLAASAIALARPDAVLLIGPALTVLLYATRRARPWLGFGLGLVPLAAWGLFAVSYYGFSWPNTAYAKLGSGIAGSELAWQGVSYLRESLRNDPLTLVLIVSALVLASRRAARAPERALAFGVALYLAWVVKLGGDFMSGRFLSAPLFTAVILLARQPRASRSARWIIISVTLLCGTFAPHATWRTGPLAGAAVPGIDARGIANERDFYLDATGLAARLRSGPDIAHRARVEAQELRAHGPALIYLSTLGSGIFGYYAGPKIHIVDAWALGDPLLARLPALRRLKWRIGHFARVAPPGYLKTLASGRNQIRDPGLARYWDALALVVRGPVFAWKRWVAIADFASGRADRLIDRERFRLADLIDADAARCAGQAQTVPQFGDGGLDLHFTPPSHAQQLELLFSGGEQFSLTWYRGAHVLASSTMVAASTASDTRRALVDVPLAARAGVDRLRLLSERGEGSYRLLGCHAMPTSP
jgi:arabinofuranosyltransferase